MTLLDRLLELYPQALFDDDENHEEYNSLKSQIEQMMYPEPHGYKIKELEQQNKHYKREWDLTVRDRNILQEEIKQLKEDKK